ncbi:uncharacterized protein TM35_000073010 [Trypanosoma theileri]|uniref:Uncharacterized protein n=1 Tax=Trypanosoma theileri TaxID=67003 RepID=A0A1X0P1R6_9TRYP|nr:uncharacterized protein TM35_000073010 [Trypanosoma theileri]ORC90877.1 hypothetical protein TM35_000073010 [Trypanosoma theileri]
MYAKTQGKKKKKNSHNNGNKVIQRNGRNKREKRKIRTTLLFIMLTENTDHPEITYALEKEEWEKCMDVYYFVLNGVPNIEGNSIICTQTYSLEKNWIEGNY